MKVLGAVDNWSYRPYKLHLNIISLSRKSLEIFLVKKSVMTWVQEIKQQLFFPSDCL